MSKHIVLIFGATGETGRSILQGFLKIPTLLMSKLSYVHSHWRPQVKKLVELGVNIRVAGLSGSVEKLGDVLNGIEILISAIDATGQLAQINLATAAKKAGVKRFIPCGFTTIAPPGGVMASRDSYPFRRKRKCIKTYASYSCRILSSMSDTGNQLSYPTVPSGRVDYASLAKPNVHIHAGGTAPTLLTDLRDIRRYVALIIKDDRTLNQSVELSGEKIERKSVSADEIITSRAQFAATAKAEPDNHLAVLMLFATDYHYSKYVRVDNTPQYAAYSGYLDAQNLYSDFKPIRFRDMLREVLAGKAEMPYKHLGLVFGRDK
ncbi:hypothetical protein C8R43DRAFT_1141567 [Mycena crocata]|nr:hypothetical protein C8R43DRAFT_1141567 [Mycena crocata]